MLPLAGQLGHGRTASLSYSLKAGVATYEEHLSVSEQHLRVPRQGR